jgi:transposase InsO family protein
MVCKVLKVSGSGYYRWFCKGSSNRELKNQKLTIIIKEVFEESKRTYGSPRVTASLKRRGVNVSKPRVTKLMRLNNLKSKVRKKYRVTTNSNHIYAISDNHLDRNFKPNALNEALVSDITYIRTNEGWLYLTIIIDLYNRQVVCWSLSKTLFTKETITPAETEQEFNKFKNVA